jgi:hypothetical protein
MRGPNPGDPGCAECDAGSAARSFGTPKRADADDAKYPPRREQRSGETRPSVTRRRAPHNPFAFFLARPRRVWCRRGPPAAQSARMSRPGGEVRRGTFAGWGLAGAFFEGAPHGQQTAAGEHIGPGAHTPQSSGQPHTKGPDQGRTALSGKPGAEPHRPLCRERPPAEAGPTKSGSTASVVWSERSGQRSTVLTNARQRW